MADGSATPAKSTLRSGWARDSEGMWRREVGALRLVVYERRPQGWRWSVRGDDFDDFGYEATAQRAKDAALSVAERATTEVSRG